MNAKKKFLILEGLLFALVFIGCSSSDEDAPLEPTSPTNPEPKVITADRRETFTFTANGTSIQGKIFIPSEYENNKNLPAIFLFDFPEGNHAVATDEFEKVIEAVKAVEGLSSLVIAMDEYKNNDIILPGEFQEYYEIFENLAAYVNDRYTSNTSRTFIARGADAGMVLFTLFFEEQETSLFQNFIATDSANLGLITEMIKNGDVSQNMENKKLHYSYTFNDGINPDNADFDEGNITFIDAVRAQDYSWLDFESVSFMNMTFENAYPTAFADGIAFIFED